MGQLSRRAISSFFWACVMLVGPIPASARLGGFHHGDGGGHHAGGMHASAGLMTRAWKAGPDDQTYAPPAAPEAPAPTRKYLTSYGEEVRNALGVRDGRIAFFSAPLSHPSGSVTPSFSAGLGHNGLSLRLDW